MEGIDRTDPSTTALTRPPAATASDDDVATMALTTVREVTNELVRLIRDTAAQATDGWSIASVVRPLVPEIEQAFEDRAALDAEVRKLRTILAGTDTRLRDLEAQLAARQSGWNAERLALETEAAREREQARTHAEELVRLRAEFDLMTARERRVREQMEASSARAHADREETLRLAREMVQAAEEARLAIVNEVDRLRSSLANEHATLVEIQHERSQATQGAAALEGELVRARQMLEQLEASRAGTAGELSLTRASLVHTEGELLAAQHEYQLAQVQLNKLCSAHDDLIEDRAQLAARLHDAKERDARLRLHITNLEQRIQTARDVTPAATASTPVTPHQSTAEVATSPLALELSRAEERARGLENELAKAKATASAATTRVETLQAETRAAELARLATAAEALALRASVAALERAARDAVENAVAPPAPAAAPIPQDDVEAVDLAPVAQDMPILELLDDEADTVAEEPVETQPEPIEALICADDVPLATEPIADEAAAIEPDMHAGTVVVFDADDAWDAPCGVTTHYVPLGPEACDRVRELDPACGVVNLAAPGALATVVALRIAKITTPLWGCAIGASGGVALGRFDVIARPVDAESVRTQLEGRVPAGANVITVGSDSSTLIPLRQGLLQGGMSVRTAWNRQQAADLAASVHPDVVILDLASDTVGLADFVVELTRCATPPLVVLVPATPQHLDDFGAALAQCGDGTPLARTDLVEAAIRDAR